MSFYSSSLDSSDAAFVLLRDLIEERIGMYFGDNRRDLLMERLAPLMLERDFDHYLDYYYLLKYDPDACDEWQRVAGALGVHETYFWREMDQIDALVNAVVPQYASGDGPRPLRIWSAACSTGEEPLTIAMALDRAGWFERLPIEIVATDVSAAAVETAKRGLYRERSLRNVPAAVRARYFTPAGSQWQIAPAMLRRVRWGLANLATTEEIAAPASAPVIFCRNVMIYFTDATIQRIVDTFGKHMPAPGHLFVGAAESLLRFASEFKLQEIGGALVYVKHR